MGSPIRVLHVVVNMNRGGAETLLMNLYRNIDRSQIQFDFLTCKEGVFDKEIMQLGGKVHRVPYVTDVGHFKYQRELKRFFTANPQYKIIHSHMDKMSGLILYFAKMAGIPVRIAHSHSTKSEGSMLARIYKWYAGRFIISNATHKFACTMDSANWLFGLDAGNSYLLYNAIELDKFSRQANIRKEIRDELEVNENSLVLGHVGRFSNPKNHFFLLEIFSEVLKINKDSYLVLVGDGPLKEKINNKLLEKGLHKNIIMVGVRGDVNKLLQGFDSYVFPSLYEGLPLSLIEAQAAGLPCIVSNVITKEVDVGLVDYVSLNQSPKEWAEIIINSRIKSLETSHILKKKGFDIKDSVSWLTSFYLKVL